MAIRGYLMVNQWSISAISGLLVVELVVISGSLMVIVAISGRISGH